MVAKVALIILILIVAAWVCQVDPCGWNICESTIQEHIRAYETEQFGAEQLQIQLTAIAEMDKK